jgi:hypothetical protein
MDRLLTRNYSFVSKLSVEKGNSIWDHRLTPIETHQGRLVHTSLQHQGLSNRGRPAARQVARPKESEKVEKAIKLMVAMSAVVAILAIAPAAFGQSTDTGYAGEGGVAGQVSQGEGGVAGETASGHANNGTAASSASGAGGGSVLAFTGLDLALIAGGGLVLLAGGVALSRLVARHPA